MIKYRLTQKGKIVVVILCTFIIICVFLGSSFKDNQANKYYDYNQPHEDTGITEPELVTAPEPPQQDAAKEVISDTHKTAVFFDANMTNLNTEYYDALNMFFENAQKHIDIKIQIEGNCATMYPKSPKQKSINYNLSLLRAQAVADYLASKGISKERLIIIGNGSDKPLKDNSSPEGRKFNRRVDVFLTNKN